MVLVNGKPIRSIYLTMKPGSKLKRGPHGPLQTMRSKCVKCLLGREDRAPNNTLDDISGGLEDRLREREDLIFVLSVPPSTDCEKRQERFMVAAKFEDRCQEVCQACGQGLLHEALPKHTRAPGVQTNRSL